MLSFSWHISKSYLLVHILWHHNWEHMFEKPSNLGTDTVWTKFWEITITYRAPNLNSPTTGGKRSKIAKRNWKITQKVCTHWKECFELFSKSQKLISHTYNIFLKWQNHLKIHSFSCKIGSVENWMSLVFPKWKRMKHI